MYQKVLIWCNVIISMECFVQEFLGRSLGLVLRRMLPLLWIKNRPVQRLGLAVLCLLIEQASFLLCCLVILFSVWYNVIEVTNYYKLSGGFASRIVALWLVWLVRGLLSLPRWSFGPWAVYCCATAALLVGLVGLGTWLVWWDWPKQPSIERF